MNTEKTVQIPVGRGLYATVDADDAPVLLEMKWSSFRAGSTDYAVSYTVSGGIRKTVYMHRFIMGLVPHDGLEIDHYDKNGLNNCRSNLRVCTHAQNQCNRKHNNPTGFRGVSKRKGNFTKPWGAQIKTRGRHINLGWYLCPEDAARAYDKAAKEYHGEFARLNFPDQ